jgi:putative FmdB family regulatory protein
MPIYEYHCKACDRTFEAWQRVTEPRLDRCEHCDARAVERLLSAPAFHLKGGGWYKDGYGSTKPAAKSETKSA